MLQAISHAGPCWRRRDELISNILLWTPSHRRAKVGRPARTYISQLCAYTECRLEDRTGAMDDRERYLGEVQGDPRWRRDMMILFFPKDHFLVSQLSLWLAIRYALVSTFGKIYLSLISYPRFIVIFSVSGRFSSYTLLYKSYHLPGILYSI